MPARASVTVSPSISSMSRSTPWVDGCCGPMLTTIRSSPRRAASSAISDQSPPDASKDGTPSVSASHDVARCDAGCLGGHRYDLRWSGGGMVAPLYSTGMPPRG